MGGSVTTSKLSILCSLMAVSSSEYTASRGSVRSTRGLGPTMTARGQSIGISIGMLPQTDYVDYGTKDIQVLHYGI